VRCRVVRAIRVNFVGTYFTASSNRDDGDCKESGTSDSAMRANSIRVGRRAVVWRASVFVSTAVGHRGSAGCHNCFASALIGYGRRRRDQ